jgi:alkylhydroperoxidase/carboxymuconolactone decarboxylase family protein YurZ
MTRVEDGFRLLAIGDPRAIASMSAWQESIVAVPRLDGRTEALLRLGALIAIDAPSPSYRSEVQAALRAGARLEDLLAVLVALVTIVGSARIVSAAPRVALAAGYDVEAALEEIDPESWPVELPGAMHG